jgi:hypothetical protein
MAGVITGLFFFAKYFSTSFSAAPSKSNGKILEAHFWFNIRSRFVLRQLLFKKVKTDPEWKNGWKRMFWIRSCATGFRKKD